MVVKGDFDVLDPVSKEQEIQVWYLSSPWCKWQTFDSKLTIGHKI